MYTDRKIKEFIQSLDKEQNEELIELIKNLIKENKNDRLEKTIYDIERYLKEMITEINKLLSKEYNQNFLLAMLIYEEVYNTIKAIKEKHKIV